MARPTPLAPGAVAARLAAELPGWDFVDGAIQRSIRTASWKATMMVVTTIGHLAEVAWHHPDLLVSYDAVTVRLSTHAPRGVTDLDFALAAKIDAVVDWQPDAPFSGTPDDPRHAYIHRSGSDHER